MVSDARLEKVKALLTNCGDVYHTENPEEDIPGWKNLVTTYRNAEGQRKYVHQYLPKYVSCWRTIRRRIEAPNDGDVISVGAGPCLCIMGWFFDFAPAPAQQVVGVDVLDWTHVRSLPSFKALLDDVLGSAEFKYQSGVFIPEGVIPPQVVAVPDLRGLPPTFVREGSTVLLPYLLNHVVGREGPLVDSTQLFRWLEAVRERSNRTVIADMQCNKAPEFWDRIRAGLGVADHAVMMESSGIGDFGPAYPPRAEWPMRRTRRIMTFDTVLVGDRKGWHFLP